MNTLLLLLITVHVVTSEETFNKTQSKPVSPEPKNAFKFEEPSQPQYGLIRFENNRLQFDSQNSVDSGQRIKFEGNRYQFDNQNSINEGHRIKFEESKVGNQKPNHQKKKRRRKPKRLPSGSTQNGGYGYPVFPGPAYPGPPMYPGPFGPPVYPAQGPYPAYPGPQYKPRPSVTSAALSAVTEALTSIALYDDAQCVPRLLCEAAGGTGSIPGAGLLQSVAGLQPLLTLLAAYNGISSSPLFVFGRAVFLGMTSKANPGTCRYAYPQCPNDPEELVHYLNNHNGGFFRFFAAPDLNQQQGLEQFYNQLSGQHYGLYQPQQNAQNIQHQQQNSLQYQQNLQQQQNALQYQQNLQHQQQNGLQYQQNSQQGYGLQFPNQNLYGQYPQQNYQNHLYQFGQGSQQQYQYYQSPNPYGIGGLYGQRYPHQKNLNQNYLKNKEIQKRILNAQNTVFISNDNPKWSFPEDSNRNNRDVNDNFRLGKVLKFPQSNVYSHTAAEGFIFPGIQSNRQYPTIDSIDSDFYFTRNVNDFGIYNQQNYGVDINDGDNDDLRTLYIVRGNGDPNNPEIVHLAPGQSL